MAEKIFLSYAHEDRGLVEAVKQALHKHGVVTAKDTIILDPSQKLKAGSYIRRMIRDQISSASKVVIIASESSAESQWVNYEAGMAVALEKPIVVIGKRGSGKSALFRALGKVQSIEMEAEA